MRYVNMISAILLAACVLLSQTSVFAETVGTSSGGAFGSESGMVVEASAQIGQSGVYSVLVDAKATAVVGNQFVTCCYTTGEILNEWFSSLTPLQQAVAEVIGGYSLSKAVDSLFSPGTTSD